MRATRTCRLSGGRWPARKRATSDPTAGRRGQGLESRVGEGPNGGESETNSSSGNAAPGSTPSCKLGVSHIAARRAAANRRRWWRKVARLAQIGLTTRRYDRLGVPKLCYVTSTFRTAGCGPACPVAWQGSSGAPQPP
jgi:hypothetical protein